MSPAWSPSPGSLPLVDSHAAGRAYAAYGGVYICASLFWLWAVESVRPDRWDIGGALLCLIGAAIVIYGPRPAAPPAPV